MRRFSGRDTWLMLVGLALLGGLCLIRGDGRRTIAQERGAGSGGYTNFETEPVRPIALSADGTRLYALNTPDDRLEIFAVEPGGLRSIGEVTVGLRPVALALVGDQAWVVNHLSDSVSVVAVADPARAQVIHTLPTGDEPRDIVAGGPGRTLVFVTSAYRGEPTRPGIGRAQVQVWDSAAPLASPLSLRLFGRKPRALAVSPDGGTVYAAIFQSGNGTTSISEEAVIASGGLPAPDPSMPIKTTATPPSTGLILRPDGPRWLDPSGAARSATPAFSLPDRDVFRIDASGGAPLIVDSYSGAGTLLFNMAIHPVSGELWVSNSEARNFVRFEPAVRGHNYLHRISQRRAAGFRAVDLNPHIDRARLPGPASERARSLVQPLEIVFRADGQRAYVAAFQSRKVGILDGAGGVIGSLAVGFGPAGLALSPDERRLFVLNHLAGSISIVDLDEGGAAGRVIGTQALRHDPLPPEVHAGRPLLYDAELTSGHGDTSCGTCHSFADHDMMAWDLGDPGGSLDTIPFGLSHDDFRLKPRTFKFHPMKGPMVTQSFRGLAGAGAMHWRGDKHGQGATSTDEETSFLQFRPAFVSLNGLADPPSEAQMVAFFRFLSTIHYPPNPLQNLDRSLSPEQAAGLEIFSGDNGIDSGITNCEGCHTLPLGTNGKVNFEGVRSSQDFKVPHLRNVYDKIGRFNVPGEQISGFGLTHDGSMDTLDHFLQTDVFDFPGATEPDVARNRQLVAEYVMAFDTGMAPAVGQQLTLRGAPEGAQRARLNLLTERAEAGDCELQAHGLADGRERGWLLCNGLYHGDLSQEAPLAQGALLAMAIPESALTFTCVPPGDGPRSALDRDLDGFRNGDELLAGTDPASAASHPAGAPALQPCAPPSPTPDATETLRATLATPTASPTPSPTRVPPADWAYMPYLSTKGFASPLEHRP